MLEQNHPVEPMNKTMPMYHRYDSLLREFLLNNVLHDRLRFPIDADTRKSLVSTSMKI